MRPTTRKCNITPSVPENIRSVVIPYESVVALVGDYILKSMNRETHCFSVELATGLGLEQAILLQHFHYWYQVNKDNTDMNINGQVWCFTSRKTICSIFPYLSEQRIRTAIDKLIERGLLSKGNFSNSKFNKVNWYALTNEGLAYFGETTNPLVKSTNDRLNQPTYNSKIEDSNIDSTPIIPKEEIPFPFGEKAKALYDELMAYPEWKKKSAHAKELRLKNLIRIAGTNEMKAIACIKQTMSKCWLDFYEPSREYYEMQAEKPKYKVVTDLF